MSANGTESTADDTAKRARLQEEVDEALGDEDIEPLGLDELPPTERDALASILRAESLRAEFDKKHPILSYLSGIPILGGYFHRKQAQYVADRFRPAHDRDLF